MHFHAFVHPSQPLARGFFEFVNNVSPGNLFLCRYQIAVFQATVANTISKVALHEFDAFSRDEVDSTWMSVRFLFVKHYEK